MRRCVCPRSLSGALGRSWTWIDESEEEEVVDEEEYARRSAILDELANAWSSIHDELEQRQFRSEWEREERREPEFDTKAEAAAYYARRQARREMAEDRLTLIEEKMAKLGARIMRPYEHWNEDERYMEYMERDRDEPDW